jgi:predicted nucleic acid-binding protein
MIVIADTSPLIVLNSLGQTDLLPVLFGTVTIPPQVAEELADARRPQLVRDFIAKRPAWLRVQAPAVMEVIPLLQAGEAAAISLAQELNADLILIDEIEGRKAATDRKIRLTGTVGVLELPAHKGLIDLEDTFGLLKKTDFWISHKLLDERLKLYQKRNH